MFDRMLLVAMAPLSLAGGAFGWAWTDASTAPSSITVEANAASVGVQGEAAQSDADAAQRREQGAPQIVTKSADGLFHIEVYIEGRPVDMIVDTGATRTILPSADATKLGLSDRMRSGGLIRTAGGEGRYRNAHVRSLTVEGIELGRFDVAIVDGSLGHGLLGQDALSRLGSMTITNDRLIVR